MVLTSWTQFIVIYHTAKLFQLEIPLKSMAKCLCNDFSDALHLL